MPWPQLIAAAIPAVGSIFSGLSRRGASKRAATSLANAGEVAKGDIYRAAETAGTGLAEAGRNAPQAVYEATEAANLGLQPYRTAGEQGITSLADLARAGFKFNYEDYANDPAFQFQLNKGTQAIANSAAARGLASSGNVLQGLTEFGQGLASTYYDQAFQRALKTFGANVDVNELLAGRGQRATEVFGANTIGAGRYAGDVGLRTAESIADVTRGAAREAAPITLGTGVAQAAGILGGNVGTRQAVAGGLNSLPDLIEAIRGLRRRPPLNG